MSVLNLLLDDNKWQQFLQEKIEKSHLTKTEEDNLIDFVNGKKYQTIASQIVNGQYTFSLPTKTLINKSGSTKKRTVYTFKYEEGMILKFLLFTMADYDSCFCDNLFSFRKNSTVKKAFFSLVNKSDINDMYVYKLDITNYFNSIDIDKLLPMLKQVIGNDDKLYNLIKDILTQDKSIYEGKVIAEKRGAMAGTTLSTFLANVYLMDLDKYFMDKGVIYARYSDDIIIFAKSLEQIEANKQYMHGVLKQKGLDINPDKESLFLPHTAWNFLGFEYCDGVIDLSKITLKKIKDKIRRKARALYRWKTNKQKSSEDAIKVMLRIFNNKFYREQNTKSLTWSKWFFPVISTHASLKVIDDYLIQYIRYLQSGKFTKKNYNLTYDDLKQLGFKSLVHEYHKQQ